LLFLINELSGFLPEQSSSIKDNLLILLSPGQPKYKKAANLRQFFGLNNILSTIIFQ